MKKIICVLSVFAVLIISCNKDKKYATIKVEIVNKNSDTIKILDETTGKELKTIVIKDGVFKDTLNVKTNGFCVLANGTTYQSLYLKNGFDLELSFDTKKPLETVFFEGEGEKENNVLKEFHLATSKIDMTRIISLDSLEFKKEMDKTKKELLGTIEGKDVIDDFSAELTKNLEEGFANLYEFYNQKQKSSVLNNSPAPTFSYENYKGGKTSLESLRGKIVYIDLWATWCGPCIKEIPNMKELEHQYKGKNVAFVSISLDEKDDYNKWKKYVKEKEMSGIQLISSDGFNTEFVSQFNVASIPRFILIDAKGKVVLADAPRPSSPEIRAAFDKLLSGGK